MQLVSNLLRGLFTFALYPGLVIALLAFIGHYVYRIVAEGTDIYSRSRRLTGALLPIVVLLFLILISNQETEPVRSFLSGISALTYLLSGALTGVVVVELGRRLMDSSDDTGPAIYSLILSATGTFIIYALMNQIFGKLSYYLFGLALVAGLVVIFRGPPIPKRVAEKAAEHEQHSAEEALQLQEQITQLENEVLATREELEKLRQDHEKVRGFVSALWQSKKEFEREFDALRDRFE